MGKFNIKFLLFIAFAAMPSTLFAGWNIEKEGPDVFGEKSARLVSDISGSSDAIIFKCNSNGEMSAHWLIRASVDNPIEALGYIIFRINKGDPVRVAAHLQGWNDNYVGLSSDDTSDVLAVVSKLKDAVGPISVGYILPEFDVKDSADISSSGSTAGSKGFIEHCTQ